VRVTVVQIIAYCNIYTAKVWKKVITDEHARERGTDSDY